MLSANTLSKIKAILFDIDGVLTDGSITVDSFGRQTISFNVKDGQLVSFMQENGYVFGAISGRRSDPVIHRLNSLNINFVRLGIQDKFRSLEEFKSLFSLESDSICYIGDDVIDLGVLSSVGFSVSPSDAIHIVQERVDYVAKAPGGRGVLREVIDKIIFNDKSLLESLATHYGFS